MEYKKTLIKNRHLFGGLIIEINSQMTEDKQKVKKGQKKMEYKKTLIKNRH